MKKYALCCALVAALCGAGALPAKAQSSDYLECAACKLMLRLVESSAEGTDGKNLVVDASRQCVLLDPADRQACERFYATYGPKFIKALKDRRAKGQSLDQICQTMGTCQ